MKIDPPKIEVVHGLVAFFDIMGFRKMLASNEPEEINTIMALIECFGMHKKDVNLEVLPKIENTLSFLKEGLKQAR